MDEELPLPSTRPPCRETLDRGRDEALAGPAPRSGPDWLPQPLGWQGPEQSAAPTPAGFPWGRRQCAQLLHEADRARQLLAATSDRRSSRLSRDSACGHGISGRLGAIRHLAMKLPPYPKPVLVDEPDNYVGLPEPPALGDFAQGIARRKAPSHPDHGSPIALPACTTRRMLIVPARTDLLWRDHPPARRAGRGQQPDRCGHRQGQGRKDPAFRNHQSAQRALRHQLHGRGPVLLRANPREATSNEGLVLPPGQGTVVGVEFVERLPVGSAAMFSLLVFISGFWVNLNLPVNS